jgi:hypothetical protein
MAYLMGGVGSEKTKLGSTIAISDILLIARSGLVALGLKRSAIRKVI